MASKFTTPVRLSPQPYRETADKEEEIEIKEPRFTKIKMAIRNLCKNTILQIVLGCVALLALICYLQEASMSQPCSEYANWRISHMPARCIKEYTNKPIIITDEE